MLRLTSPGIPDLYQGTEFWDFSLVDPDNRRPVDYAARERALDAGAAPDDLVDDWRDGRLKQAVIARALDLRKRHPGVFALGSYERLQVEGPMAPHVIAFARSHEDRSIVVVVPRLSAKLSAEGAIRFPADAWAETTVMLPRNMAERPFQSLFSSALISPESNTKQGQIDVSALFEKVPVALLEG